MTRSKTAVRAAASAVRDSALKSPALGSLEPQALLGQLDVVAIVEDPVRRAHLHVAERVEHGGMRSPGVRHYNGPRTNSLEEIAP